jgi:hypothetical protein
MFRSFFHDHLQGVLRCALCRYYSSRGFAFFEFVLLRSMWPHVYVICTCLVFLSIGDLLVNCVTENAPCRTLVLCSTLSNNSLSNRDGCRQHHL